MKIMPRATALAVALSMGVLSPGMSAWAAVAEVRLSRVGGRGPVVPGAGIPGAPNIPTLDSRVLILAVGPDSSIGGVSATLDFAVGAAPSEKSIFASADARREAIGGVLSPAAGAHPAAVNFDGTRGRADGIRSDLAAVLAQWRRGAALRLGARRMPDPGRTGDRAGDPDRVKGDIDELGNPRRRGGEGGPDDAQDPDRRDDSRPLFAAMTAGSLSGAVASVPLFANLAVILVSIALHEIAHAKVADWRGDPTARLAGRASLNPLTWYRHFDPFLTGVLPLASYLISGFAFGAAKPVPVSPQLSAKDKAWVAFAGPAMNLALAGFGALAYAGAMAGGLGSTALGVLTSVVFINSVLFVFNAAPLPFLDGRHVLTGLVPRGLRERVGRTYSWLETFGLPLVIPMVYLSAKGFIGAALALTSFLISVSVSAAGVQLAGAALPAVAALGLALSASNPQEAPSAVRSIEPRKVVVRFSGPPFIAADRHLGVLDRSDAAYAQDYQSAYGALLAEAAAFGLTPEELASYNASPIASYRRINAMTFTLDAAKTAEFIQTLRQRGHAADLSGPRRIIAPVPDGPASSAKAPVTMDDNLRLTGADRVHAVAEKLWGKPDMNPWQRLAWSLLHPLSNAAPPQPVSGAIDSGADLSHVLLKRVKEVVNGTSGENVDDIGHGSWVTSMGLHYAPWSRNVRHYKAFVNGGADLDDVLKALTTAANDGWLVISNSWGADSGDPDGPDSQLVRRLAEEGHILVFAAGNSGPAGDTINSPAIVYVKDPKTGAVRVLSVAAADRDKTVAPFSSRGPGSEKTKDVPNYPLRPDLAAIGVKAEGAWPAALGDADRVDPRKGPMKALYGTSMATPAVWGAILLLLMMFGVTEKGGKLDSVVAAVMESLEKTGKNGRDAEGGGFLNVEAAYERLHKEFFPGAIPPTVVSRYRELSRRVADFERGQAEFQRLAAEDPTPARNDLLEEALKRVAGHDEDLRASRELRAAYTGIEYEAAGPLDRVRMRLSRRDSKPSGERR